MNTPHATPTTPNPASEIHAAGPIRIRGDDATIDPHACYWTCLNIKGVRAGPLPPMVLSMLADEVPEPVENLHAVCIPADEGLLVCAVPRRILSHLPQEVSTLSPSSLPAGFDADPRLVNILVGHAEPARIRHARHATRTLLWITLLATLAGISLGLHRFTQFTHAQTLAHRRSMTQSLQSAAGDGVSEPELRDSLRLLQSESIARASRPPVHDAALELATFLTLWPQRTRADVRSLAITPNGASASVEVPAEDAADLLARIPIPTGWKLLEPRVHAIDRSQLKFSQITVEWKRSNPARPEERR